MNREDIISQAKLLVGVQGEVRDYQCSCHPGGDRFIVKWFNNKGKFPVCYNLEELLKENI